MPNVTLRYWAAARAAAGVEQEAFEAETPADLLEQALQRHPSLGPVLQRCSYLVDGVALHDRQGPLIEGQVVEALPPFAGGSQ
jgi:sulfur-carrier protein